MKRIIHEILKGYLAFIKRISTIFIYLGASLAVSAVIVLPLWALASRKPELFSLFAVILFIVLVALLITARIRSRERKSRSAPKEKYGASRVIMKTGLALFLVAGLYSLTLLIMRGLYGAVIPGALIYFFVLGYGFFASKFSKKSS